MKTTNTEGWTLKQGLAAQYAAQAGLDPNLGAQAGEAAWDVLRSTREAVDEPNPQRRAKLARKAIQRLSRADLGHHRELAEQVTGVLNAIARPETKASINPRTGLQEFDLCELWDPDCIRDPIEEITVTGRMPILPGYRVYDGIEYVGGHPVANVGSGGSAGYDSDYEYGTPQNPVPDPPEGIDQIEADQPNEHNRRWPPVDPILIADASGNGRYGLDRDGGFTFPHYDPCRHPLAAQGVMCQGDSDKPRVQVTFGVPEVEDLLENSKAKNEQKRFEWAAWRTALAGGASGMTSVVPWWVSAWVFEFGIQPTLARMDQIIGVYDQAISQQ